MISTSAAFQAAVQQSHTVVSRVEVYRNGVLQGELYPVAGSVQVDARRAVRRTCSLQFVDYDGTLTPTTTSGLLAPYVAQLRLYRGVQLADGTQELVPLGVFQVVSTDVQASNDGVSIDVQGEDLSRVIMDKRWAKAKVLDAGANVVATLRELADSRLPGNATNIAASSMTLPTAFRPTLGKGLTQNPWEDMLLLAQSIGHELWMDATGTLVGAPHPPNTGASVLPVATYGSGNVLLSVRRSLTLDGVQNALYLTGEAGANGSEVEGYAADTAAASPTSISSIGERAITITSPLITTSARADTVAALLLRAYVGQPVEFSIVANPALDARDLVRVQDERIGMDSLVVLDALDISLTGADMTLTGRAVS